MTPKQIIARVQSFNDKELNKAIEGLQPWDSYQKKTTDAPGSWTKLKDGRILVVVAVNKFDPKQKLVSYFY